MRRWLCVACALAYGFAMDLCLKRGDFNLAFLDEIPSQSMACAYVDEIARNVDRILVLKSSGILMSGTPREIFARGEELLGAGLDVPQVTRIAMALKDRGLEIDPAVYTTEELEQQLLGLRKGGAVC